MYYFPFAADGEPQENDCLVFTDGRWTSTPFRQAKLVSIAVPQLDPGTQDDGTRIANPFTGIAININSMIQASFKDTPNPGVAIASVFVDGIQIGIAFQNTGLSQSNAGNFNIIFEYLGQSS